MTQELMTISEQIEAALQRAPNGLTSRELADALGKNTDAVSSCAYKMFLRGKLKRETERQMRQTVGRTWRWRAKGK